MGIADEIIKLITEHGSAAILREKVGLLELKRSEKASECDKLTGEVAKLSQEVERLKTEKAKLQADLDNASAEIQRQKQNEQATGGLDAKSKEILCLIANADRITKEEVLRRLALPKAKGEYHFDLLVKRAFVETSCYQPERGSFVHATPAGRDYLAEAGLL